MSGDVAEEAKLPRPISIALIIAIIGSTGGWVVTEALQAKEWQRRIVVLEERAKSADERYDHLLNIMQDTREAVARLEERLKRGRQRFDTLE